MSKWTTTPVNISLADCKRVSDLLPDDWAKNRVAAVMSVLEAFNAFVTGDPVGMVRRSPEGAELAVSAGNRKWWLHNFRDEERPRLITDDPVIPSWPVLYDPESGGGVL